MMQPCCCSAGLLTTLLVLLLLGSADAAEAPLLPTAGDEAVLYGKSTVIVSNTTYRPVVLQTLFNVALDTIVFLTPNFTLVPAAWAYVSADTPYILNRNFTILSQREPPTVMDWNLLDSKTVMAPGTTFLFDNLVLINTRCGVYLCATHMQFQHLD
jgi:hypothetical protein